MKHKWLWLALFVVVDVIGVGAILVENMPMQTVQAQYEQPAQTGRPVTQPEQTDQSAQIVPEEHAIQSDGNQISCAGLWFIIIIPFSLLFVAGVWRSAWIEYKCAQVDNMPTSTEAERDTKERRMAELGYYDW